MSHTKNIFLEANCTNYNEKINKQNQETRKEYPRKTRKRKGTEKEKGSKDMTRLQVSKRNKKNARKRL